MKHPEYELQKQVCVYLELQYKSAVFLSDTVANCKLTAMQATRNKAIQKQGFKTPDLIILEPRGDYHGLLIELKVKSPFRYLENQRDEEVKVIKAEVTKGTRRPKS